MGRLKSNRKFNVYDLEDSPCWYCWYDDKQQGKRVRKSTGYRKDEYTDEQVERIINQVTSNKPNVPEYSIQWMEGYIINRLELKNKSQANVRSYRDAFKHFIAVFGGDYDIRDVTRGAASKMQQNLHTEGFVPSTNNLWVTCLSCAYNMLIKDDILEKNPFYGFEPLNVPEKKKDLTAKELGLLLKEADNCEHEDKKHLCKLAIFIGLRRQEILEIRREDVDLSRGLFTAKVLKRRKMVMLTRPIEKEVAWHEFKYFMDRYGDKEYPFKVCAKSTFSRWMRELQDQAGLKDSRCLQAIRHTFITQGLKNGYTTREMFRYIGHASITTMEGYAHDNEVTVAPSPLKNIG